MYHLMAIIISLVFIVFTVSGITVKISTGRLSGYQAKATTGKHVNVFKRIPYAAPPVGDLRFRKPRPPEKWDGILDATEYGPACMSNTSTTTSPQKWVDEDCLHVNIFAGANCLRRACPVVFYIHGGGFYYDSAVMFNDHFLINNFGGNDIVLVIPGMRLGFFGLLDVANEDVVPTNIAAYDLMAALMFVQKDIKHFGGNPNDVTIFGHSNGATAVAQFLFSKQIDPSRRLFHKGVLMSSTFEFADDSLRQDDSAEFAFRAKCLSDKEVRKKTATFLEGVVDCLRHLDSFELLRIQREMEDDENRSPRGLTMTGPLFKATDLRSFLHNPSPRPMLIGTTAQEFDSRYTNASYWARSILKLLEIKNPDEIFEQYEKDEIFGKLPFHHAFSTQYAFLSSRTIAHEMRKTGEKVYLYSYRNPRHPYHTDDLFYIMGIHPFNYDVNEEVLSVIYPQFFISFIKSGIPRRDWIPLQEELDNYMYIDVNVYDHSTPHMANYYEHDVINYWRKLKELDLQISKKKRKVVQRLMSATSSTNLSGADLLIGVLPVAAVVIAVVMTVYIVRQKQRKRKHHNDYNEEKTPLI